MLRQSNGVVNPLCYCENSADCEGCVLYLTKDSLQKKLSDWKENLSVDSCLPQCCEKNLILSIDEMMNKVRDIASAVSFDRDNALAWVKENLLKASYAQAHGGYMNVAEINLEAELFCHAIQVFVNRMIIPKLVGSKGKKK